MFGRLELTRPLAVFDIESTGVNPARDRIVEISVMKLFPDGTQQSTTRRLNPADIAQKLHSYLADCDLAGYNITTFDVPLLECEFKRAGLSFDLSNRKIIDAYNIFCKLYPRTLSAAYNFFCGKELVNAHGAAADTAATLEVLLGQLDKHPELSGSVEQLAAASDLAGPDAVDRTRRFKWSGDEVVVNFGKNSGRTLRDLAENDPGFLRWIIKNDFPDDVKEIASNALIGKYPTRSAGAGE